MFFRKYHDETRLVGLNTQRLSSLLFAKWVIALLLAIAGVMVISTYSHLFGPPLFALLLTAVVAAILVSLRPSMPTSRSIEVPAQVASGIETVRTGASLFLASPIPGFLVDCESMRILEANQAATELYGFDPDNDRPASLSDLLDPDAMVEQSCARFPANGLSRHRRADGSSFWVELQSRRIEYNAHPVWLVVAADVTARVKLEHDLEISERRVRELVDLSLGIVFTHDLDGRLQMVNPAFARALGCPAEALVGHCLAEFVAPGQRDAFARYLQEVEKTGSASGVLNMLCHGGRECVWEFRNLLREAVDGTRSVLGSAIDISERSHDERRSPEPGCKDPLTGCYNRRHLEIFSSEVEPAARWAAIVVDLDHLKPCNDSHAQRAGDQAIVRTARMLTGMVRKGDSVVRLGSDAFVILLRRCDQVTLESFALRLQRLRENPASVPFTFGLTMRRDSEDLEQTLHRADRQMLERRFIERSSARLDEKVVARRAIRREPKIRVV
jgi:diguanylate cyclase (GGDEF)-like protein/PAS domain S-box-containing protein